MFPKRAVFLDRAGVVNQVVFRHGQPASPRTLAEFVWTDGIQTAVQQLKAANLPVFVVTNQPDIARQKMSPLVLEQMHQMIDTTLAIDDLRVCPHDNQDHCACRKPKPGMLMALADQWQVDLSQSFMIGDSWKDMAAGKQSGCRSILLDRSYNQGTEADFIVADVPAAVELILRLTREGVV